MVVSLLGTVKPNDFIGFTEKKKTVLVIELVLVE